MLLDSVLTTDLADCARHANDLAAAGISGAFTYEGQTDPFFPLVPAAIDAKLDLYTNVAIALPRSPMHLAYQAWDLQKASGGRFTLGLGSQIKPHIERRYSAVWDKPVAQMRDLIRATKAIFESWQNETPLHYEGPYYQHTLSIPPLTPKPLTHAVTEDRGTAGAPPIWAGALGPVMTKMVAAEADGIIIHPFNSAHFLREHSHKLVAESQAAVGRDLNERPFVFNVGAMVGLGRTDEEVAAAYAGVRGQLGFYGSTPAYRVVLDAHGWGELQPQLRTLTKEGRWAELGTLYSDDQVSQLATVGTPKQVAAELKNRYAGIADRISIQAPFTNDPTLLVELAEAWNA